MNTRDITITGEDFSLYYTPAEFNFWFVLTERFRCLHKGRRFGATQSAANFSIEKLIDGKKGLWVDTIQNNLDRYFSRYFYPALKKHIKPEYYRYRQKQKDLRLLSGLLEFVSAEKPANIEGFGYDFIIVNEAGIVLKGQKGRDLWFNSIRAMLMDYAGDCYFIGTPKGKKAKKDETPHKTSLYYDLCCKGGLDGHPKESNWIAVNQSSYDNPLLPVNEIKEMEDDVPRVTRAQEIFGKFIDIGDEDVFHAEWFNIVYELPPDHLWLRKIISEDTAFKKGSENDDSAGGCFLETTLGIYWLDSFNEKLEFPELIKKSKEFYMRHEPDLVLIEDKASGQSLIQMFERQVNFPVKKITPKGDKYSRAVAATPPCEAGKIFVLFGAWNDQAIDQLCDFNARLDTPDDIVDYFSQAINYFKGSTSPLVKPESRKNKQTSKILTGY